MYRSTFFLTSALVRDEWSASRPCRFTPGERTSGAQWIRDWMDPRAGLDDVEKRKYLILPGLELRTFGRPTHGQSPYRLRYPGSLLKEIYFQICANYFFSHKYVTYKKPSK
jgi:hypothetical protein